MSEDAMSDDVTLRPGGAEEAPRMAEFIVRMNRRHGQRCLHCSDDVAGVARDLAALGRPIDESVVLATAGDRIVGLVAADFAEEQERGWLWGPFADDPDPLPLAGRLVDRLLAQAPPGIRMIDCFLDEGSVFLEPLAARHGFAAPRTVHIYRADRPAAGYPAAPEPAPGGPADLVPLRALHDAAFPNTWRSAEELVASDNEAHALFVHREEGRCVGYIHVDADPAEESAHVHYLAVTPGARGRGIGRRLLDQGLDWCFNGRRAESVALTVLDGLANARALYESAGFRLLESGVTRRWTRE
jgi:GNAT superfamily N-acetyltransferase